MLAFKFYEVACLARSLAGYAKKEGDEQSVFYAKGETFRPPPPTNKPVCILLLLPLLYPLYIACMYLHVHAKIGNGIINPISLN